MTSSRVKFTIPPNLQHSPWRTTGFGAIKVCAQVKFLPNSYGVRGPWDLPPSPGHQTVSVPTLLTGQILDFLLEAVNGKSLTIALPILPEGKTEAQRGEVICSDQ